MFKCLKCCVTANVSACLFFFFFLSYPVSNEKYLNRVKHQIIPCLKTSKLSRLPIIISSHFKLILVVSDKTIFEHISFLSGIGWLVGWFLNVLVNYWVISRTGPKTERLTILRATTHETELGHHDFCLSRSHYTDTDPTSSMSGKIFLLYVLVSHTDMPLYFHNQQERRIC